MTEQTGEIVKVQVPVYGDVVALIYAKGRDRMTQQPITNYLREKMEGRYKAYFRAHYSSIVGWAIGERVADQDW